MRRRAALSPDGRLLVYASDRSGEGVLDLWIRQTAAGDPHRLTSGIGTVLNPLYGSIASNTSANHTMQSVAKFIIGILPNFANYDVKNPIINPGQQLENTTFYGITVIGYGLLYIAILLIAGMLIFDRREV